MKRIRLGQRGDTIVEVLLAVTILSVVLSTTYSLASRGFRKLQAAKDRTQAVFYVQEQAEALRAFRDADTWDSFRSNISARPNTFHFITSGGGPFFWEPQDNSRGIRGFTIFIDKNDPTVPLVGFRDLDADGSNETFTAVVKAQWTGIGTDRQEEVAVVTRLRDSEITGSLAPPPPPPPPPPPAEICGNVIDDNSNGTINEGCPTQFTDCGGPGGMGVGNVVSCNLGTQRYVTGLRISVGCNDGESATFRATFDDGSNNVFNAGCGSTFPISPEITQGMSLEMLSGGGGDNFISFTCCGSSGWGADWR